MKEFIQASPISKKEMDQALKFIAYRFPRYQSRFSYPIACAKIRRISSMLQLGSDFENYAIRVLDVILPYIKQTKEDLIVGVVCTLSFFTLEIPHVSMYQLCSIIGIAPGSLQTQIAKKIVPPLHIKGFTSTLASAPLIKKVMQKLVPLPFQEKKGLKQFLQRISFRREMG
jgi:hypothetical protein